MPREWLRRKSYRVHLALSRITGLRSRVFVRSAVISDCLGSCSLVSRKRKVYHCLSSHSSSFSCSDKAFFELRRLSAHQSIRCAQKCLSLPITHYSTDSMMVRIAEGIRVAGL